MENYCKNCGCNLKPTDAFCPECGKIANTNICPNCNAKITKDTAFCPQCGMNLKGKNCPGCGKPIKANERYCENCGTNLNAPEKISKNSFFENNKIPLIIIATLVIVVAIIVATVSLVPEDVGTQVTSVGSNRFEIPGDYAVDPSTIDVDYTGYNAVFSQGYSNDHGDLIYIGVMNVPPGVDGDEVVAAEGGVQKNMMGVSGYYNEEGDIYTFAFADGAYLNVISASSPEILDKITYLG